jgi:TorA maturation chaperone TorD
MAVQFAFAGRAFLDTDRGRLAEFLQDCGASIDGAAEALDALGYSSEDLEREYVRLFLNPAGASCSPWQSAYEAQGRLMGPAHASAVEWYANYGASPRASSEPADHVGLLLTFYAQLLVSGATEDDLTAFSERHLTWIPEFASKVHAEASHPFYRWLGRYAADLVRGRVATLDQGSKHYQSAQ